MAMSKTAKLMMMSNGHGRNQYDYDEEEHKPEKYKENHHKSKIRAGGTFWMEDPRAEKKMEFDRHAAEQWVANMDKADGSGKGGKWTYEQTEQVKKQKGFDCDGPTFFAVMNMLYSDYAKTLTKYGVTSPEAYADLAKDWIYDEDAEAGDKKTALYYHCIVK